MTVTVRTASSADAERIGAIKVICWRDTYVDIMPSDFLADLADNQHHRDFIRRVGARADGNGGVMLAEEGGIAIGYVIYGPGEPTAECDAELNALYVIPECQRRGVGKTLFNAAIADLLSLHFGSMMLWALEDNPNRGFYQHLGGHKTRSRGLDIGGNPMSEVAYVWPELSTP